eukprot:769737-Pyramimonas_sp.AAC.1
MEEARGRWRRRRRRRRRTRRRERAGAWSGNGCMHVYHEADQAGLPSANLLPLIHLLIIQSLFDVSLPSHPPPSILNILILRP